MSREFPPKEEWPPGPWHNEPDREEWECQGFPCLARRNHYGAWCGYVAVPPGHPWHGKGWSEPDDPDIEVHGGITFAGECQGDICHVPKPGAPDNVWWLGFDCNHAGDKAPGMDTLGARIGLQEHYWETYRDLAYVKAETERLADQVLAAEGTT